MTKKKRVLFVIDTLNCGGAEKSLVSLLSLLNYEYLVVSLSIVRRGGSLEHNLSSRVHLLPFPEPPRFCRFLSNVLFSGTRRLISLLGIRRHGAEIGWLCKRPFYPAFNGYFDIAIAYQQGFPTYYVADKVHAGKKYAWINTDLKNAGYRVRFNRPFYDKMTRVFAVSLALCEILPSAGFVVKEKISLVKDVLNVNLIRELSTASVDFSFCPGRIKLLTVGRIVPPKNYPLAVEAARLLHEKGFDYEWVFVGDGPDRNSIENKIKTFNLGDRILLAGQQTNPYPYFAQCDIYVQTSSFEGFGLTLSEAKILHKPIVTTNFPSAYDQIIDGENGLIAEMTPESVAEKIIKLIENPTLKNRLIKNTRKEENLTAKTESEKVNQLLLGD